MKRKQILREQLYANQLNNVEEIEKFLQTHKLPKLTQEQFKILNRPTSKVIESAIKNTPRNEGSGPDGVYGEFYPTFEQSTPIFLKFFK